MDVITKKSNIVFSKYNAVLMLGVGGVSVGQLAKAYLKQGYTVYGYDQTKNQMVDDLIGMGLIFSQKFTKQFLNVDFCVRTAAVKDDNPFVAAAVKTGILVLDRAYVLGQMLKQFKTVIAVAGTHGKSTTCALIYEILRAAGKKVSCHIGADICNARFEPGDDYAVVEACEYNKSFLKIYPHVTVVTNVEPEHLDSYGSFKNLKTAFLTFLKRGDKRFVFDCESNKFLQMAKNVNIVQKEEFKSKLKGEYNQKNIALAVAVCCALGVDKSVAVDAANMFAGVPRRYEFLGQAIKTKIYIDYAHHPTEIAAFLSAFNVENKNALIVFQPHTYSRTKMFLPQFVDVLSKQNNVCIFKEYPAREQKSAGVDAKTLYKLIKQKNSKCKYASTGKKIKQYLGKYNAIAFVGAGDICQIAKWLLTCGKD